MGATAVPVLARAFAVTAAAAGIYATVGRKWLLKWGATDEERQRYLPGDELLPHPVYQTTRAIHIDAPPMSVWPWLVQMGQGRGGFYSFDWVENLAGLEIHSADEIVPEYQDLSEGDLIRLAPHTGLVAEIVQPNKVLVLRAAADIESKRPPKPTDPGYFNWTWTFVLEPADPGATRLIIRLRAETARGMPLDKVGPLVWEPLHFLMERQMLRNIQERAERTVVFPAHGGVPA